MLPDNILFTESPTKEISAFLTSKSYSQVAVLADANTHRLCYPLIRDALRDKPVITVPAGEEHKTLSTCATVWQELTDLRMDRHGLVIVLGGGVIGDLGGFCAATYKRGVDFMLVPTTLLAQVDASIGGKLGIDFNHYKNHIGVFQLPAATLLHSGFLDTLPRTELRSGYMEVIKHILTSDKSMWARIRTRSLEELNWPELIRHSVEFKAQVITEDPREKGLRKILNAGHTIGHALESYFISIGARVLHGEAIAVGMIAEAFIAHDRGMLTGEDLAEIAQYIVSIFGKVQLTTEQGIAIGTWALQDKKNRGDQIMCVLLEGIGSAKWDVPVSMKDIERALGFYRDQI